MLSTGVLRIFENAAKRATEKYRGASVQFVLIMLMYLNSITFVLGPANLVPYVPL